MNTDELVEKLLNVHMDFTIFLADMIKDAKNESFKMNKFTNRMENFCTESIRNVRGF